MVYADQSGVIGWQMFGQAPRRRKGWGLIPAPGWDPEYGWEPDPLPAEELPHIKDPAEGFVATANNQPLPDGVGPFLGVDWLDGYRVASIARELERPQRLGRAAHAGLADESTRRRLGGPARRGAVRSRQGRSRPAGAGVAARLGWPSVGRFAGGDGVRTVPVGDGGPGGASKGAAQHSPMSSANGWDRSRRSTFSAIAAPAIWCGCCASNPPAGSRVLAGRDRRRAGRRGAATAIGTRPQSGRLGLRPFAHAHLAPSARPQALARSDFQPGADPLRRRRRHHQSRGRAAARSARLGGQHRLAAGRHRRRRLAATADSRCPEASPAIRCRRTTTICFRCGSAARVCRSRGRPKRSARRRFRLSN